MKNQGGNAGNQGGNIENQDENAGNQGGNAGNQGGNVGNQGGNAGNRGGNAGNIMEQKQSKTKKKFLKSNFIFLPETEKENEIRIIIKR